MTQLKCGNVNKVIEIPDKDYLQEEEEYALSLTKTCTLLPCSKRYAVRDSDAITPELYCSVDCELTEGEKELLDGSDTNLRV